MVKSFEPFDPSSASAATLTGAAAYMAGRANLSALGAAGEAGVDRVEWFHADMIRTMSLIGAGSVGDLDRSFFNLPTEMT